MTIQPILPILLGWCCFISILAVCVTVSDKRRAVRHRRRVRESTLLWIAAIGGGIAMYVTMRIIRHKTLHKKFMVGIPLILLAEAAAAAALFWLRLLVW